MRKQLFLAALLISLAPGLAMAGEIYGKIMEGSKPVGAGVGVAITCAGKTYSSQTDKDGSYQLAPSEEGKCTLTVRYKNQAPTIEVASYEDAVQVDLVLELKDGKYTLRRK